jgi:hypothetical protein
MGYWRNISGIREKYTSSLREHLHYVEKDRLFILSFL